MHVVVSCYDPQRLFQCPPLLCYTCLCVLYHVDRLCNCAGDAYCPVVHFFYFSSSYFTVCSLKRILKTFVLKGKYSGLTCTFVCSLTSSIHHYNNCKNNVSKHSNVSNGNIWFTNKFMALIFLEIFAFIYFNILKNKFKWILAHQT